MKSWDTCIDQEHSAMGRVMGPGFILSKQSEAVEERLTNVIRRSSFEVSFEEKVAVCQIKEEKTHGLSQRLSEAGCAACSASNGEEACRRGKRDSRSPV